MNLSCELKQAVKVSYLDGCLFVGDDCGISVSVTEDGLPFALSGDVSAFVLKADGTTDMIEDGTISENVASITIPGSSINIPGKVSISIRLSTGGVILTLAVCVANIYG